MKKGRGEEREGGRVRLGERKEKRQQEGRDYVYIFLLLVWDIFPGFVLCDPSSLCHMRQRFEAQIAILEYKSIICAGYSAVLHIHSVIEEVQISVSLPENSLVLHVATSAPKAWGGGQIPPSQLVIRCHVHVYYTP